MRTHSDTGGLTPVFFFATLLFLSVLSRLILAPLLPFVQEDMNLSGTAAGSLFLLTAAGYGTGIILAGFSSSHLMYRGTIIVSFLVLGSTLICISRVTSAVGMQIGSVLLGISAGLYFPSGMATISAIAGPGRIGRAIAIHEVGPSLSFILAPLLVSLILGWADWRTVFLALGVVDLVFGILCIVSPWGRSPGESPNLTRILMLFRRRDFLVTALLFGVMIGSSQGVYSLLPAYLIGSKGMDARLVNTVIGLSRVSGLFAVLLSGILTDRFGIRKALFAIILTTGLLTILLGVTGGTMLIAIVFLQPALLTAFFPAGLSAAGNVGTVELRRISLSMIVTVGYFLGAGVVPSFLGIAADVGLLSAGFSVLGVLMLASLPLLGTFGPAGRPGRVNGG